MASDLQEQLAILRRRIAKIDSKYSDAVVSTVSERNPERYCVEKWLDGVEVQTPHGAHFETERFWESHRRHGSLDISTLCEQPEDLLDAITEGLIPNSHWSRWAFLDTETTGLAGGSGTYAFLIGVGRITPEGFRLRQFFMRDLGEEASLLHALEEHLSGFETLVTYNGKTYDQPLLETRYCMARRKPPFGRMAHFDLLHGAAPALEITIRQLRLVELENQILGVEREGDLPGAMIPYVYFDYLRTKEAFRIAPILHHNAIDILTLACLTAIVPWAFRSPSEARFTHGAEMVGLGRWLRSGERAEQALELFRRAIDKGLPDELMFRTMWDVAQLEKKLGREAAALEVYTDLAGCRNAHRIAALEELAKYYEHRVRNYSMALEFTVNGLAHGDSDALRHRKARLEKRLAGRGMAGLL